MKKRELPSLVVAADWSVQASKRWMARVRLKGDKYEVLPPEPVGEPERLLARLRDEVGAHGSVLVGFDFPIGLPAAYAQKAELGSFREGLPLFGKARWGEFYRISPEPMLYRPFFPPPSQKKGEYRRAQLLEALCFANIAPLLRRCDPATPLRARAECIFWTLGPRQVGRATIHGWSRVVQPASAEVQIWPFDGELCDLLREPGITIAEIYPGEAYSHLGFTMGAGPGRKKTSLEARRSVAKHLLDVGDSAPIRFAEATWNWIAGGFKGEDDFDAMVGLLSMLLVVTRKRTSLVPEDAAVRKIEGWILGQDAGETTEVKSITSGRRRQSRA